MTTSPPVESKAPARAIELPEGTVIGETGTVLIVVKYPYRKSLDVVMHFSGDCLMHCLQCKRDFYAGLQTLINHVRRHDRRVTVRRLAA